MSAGLGSERDAALYCRGRSPGATGSGPLNDVAFGDGRFVAVGDQELVLESLTGLPGTWSVAASPPGATAALLRVRFVP